MPQHEAALLEFPNTVALRESIQIAAHGEHITLGEFPVAGGLDEPGHRNDIRFTCRLGSTDVKSLVRHGVKCQSGKPLHPSDVFAHEMIRRPPQHARIYQAVGMEQLAQRGFVTSIDRTAVVDNQLVQSLLDEQLLYLLKSRWRCHSEVYTDAACMEIGVDMFDLTGKTVLITGASSGFGAHFAEVLGRANAHLYLAARRTQQLERIAADLPEAVRPRVSILTMDVSKAESVTQALSSVTALDVVVNNAGVVRNAAALEQSEADWDSVLDTNLKGAFLVSQAAGRIMAAQGRGGSIINIASILGIRQSSTVLPYAVSKAGLIQMTKVLALELARFNIRVNALAPGYFHTQMNGAFWSSPAGESLIRRIPQRRLGQLPDLDGPLLLLASEASRYMTGVALAVDGGHLVAGL